MQIGYVRVSTNDQNTDLQRNALNCAGCELIFEDKISGTKSERPGLKKLLRTLSEGDTLVVWKLDRLGRSMRHLVVLVEELRERGVNFRSLTDSIDTSTPMGRFFFHVMGALAEMERELIVERTSAGLAAARAQGRIGGRRPKLTQAQWDQAGRLIAAGESRKRVALIYDVGLGETINLAKNAVPATRRVNSKPLTGDITLSAADVNAFALGMTGDYTLENDKSVGWNWKSGVYNVPTGGASKLILHFNMNIGSCPAVQFCVNYKNGGISYRSARDDFGFELDWTEFYTTTRKPSAGDVGALPVSGGVINGNLGIGTPNILGGSSIVLGDNDTGLKQNGDGLLDIYANGVQVFRFQNDTLESKKSINVTGRLTPTDYGNFDSRYVQDIRLGSLQYAQVWNGPGFSDTSGYVITGITNGNSDELVDGAHRRPIQKLIGNQWYNVVSI
ncbi:recombinase family protein [Salmonella enterica]|nr:recombinase family protein [Salmonella enterica]